MNLKTISFAVLLCIVFSFELFSQSKKQWLYEIKIYHFQTKEQEDTIDKYLKNAYLPALNRKGIKPVGVFKTMGNDTLEDKRIYVFIPFKSLKQYSGIPAQLQKDKQHAESGKSYLAAAYNNAPYKRLESILLRAFKYMPSPMAPKLKNSYQQRVYELRSYESATEQLHINKVHMFNEGGEIDIFSRLGFNAVFYGSVIAGSSMPNLMYMTSFEDKSSRDAHWTCSALILPGRGFPQWIFTRKMSPNQRLFSCGQQTIRNCNLSIFHDDTSVHGKLRN